mgnify:CR=1 FL=1
MDAAASTGLPVCLMHMQGEPGTMQKEPVYQDVCAEVAAFLLDRADACVAAGIGREQLLFDPGFGFGKTLQHNLDLFRDLPGLVARGYPLLIGVSRKSMIGRLLGRDTRERLAGGLEAVRRQPGVPQAGLGAMGFCFGGLSVLDMARADLPGLRAVISIHGILAAPGTPGRPVSASVLALHGWEDPFADPDAVKAFAEEMTAAGADWQLHAYGHARHAFSFPRANKPEMGIVYEPRAAARTWRTIPSFFDETLRG